MSIRYRKRVIYDRLKRRATSERKHLYHIHVKILKALIETDKTLLPACIKYQDRGKMMFPHHDLLPFCRDCSKAIKTYLNATLFHQLGREIVIVSNKLFPSMYMHNYRVFSFFRLQKGMCSPCWSFTRHLSLKTGQEVDTTIGRVLYNEVLVRVINTMANSFFRSQNLLNRIADNKGVDAQVSL